MKKINPKTRTSFIDIASVEIKRVFGRAALGPKRLNLTTRDRNLAGGQKFLADA